MSVTIPIWTLVVCVISGAGLGMAVTSWAMGRWLKDAHRDMAAAHVDMRAAHSEMRASQDSFGAALVALTTTNRCAAE